MANLRRRIPQQTESLFTENHEPFFNSIGQSRRLRHPAATSAITLNADIRSLQYLTKRARSGCHSKAASRPIPASISSMVGNEYESLIVFEPLPS